MSAVEAFDQLPRKRSKICCSSAPQFLAFLRAQQGAQMRIARLIFACPFFGKVAAADLIQGGFHETFQLQFFEAGKPAEDTVLPGKRRETHRMQQAALAPRGTNSQ